MDGCQTEIGQHRRAETLVSALEGAKDVCRRPQFFRWTQGAIQALVPHDLMVCGAYDRARKAVRLEAFNSVVVDREVLGLLTDGQSPFLQQALADWMEARGKPVRIELAALAERHRRLARDVALLQASGLHELLIHAVHRPHRPSEVETVFVFGSPGARIAPEHLANTELLLPYLHATYRRVQLTEVEIAGTAATAGVSSRKTLKDLSITEREIQILDCVRQGMSNKAIGVACRISPLTAKNHVQKILKKLDASNRAQAASRALSLGL